jgi:hypothetical protein
MKMETADVGVKVNLSTYALLFAFHASCGTVCQTSSFFVLANTIAFVGIRRV